MPGRVVTERARVGVDDDGNIYGSPDINMDSEEFKVFKERARKNAEELEARIRSGEVLECEICHLTINDVSGDMLTINEVSNNYTGSWCYSCAVGLCATILQSLPEEHQRKIVTRYVRASSMSDSDIHSMVSADISSLYGVMNPDLVKAFDEAASSEKPEA